MKEEKTICDRCNNYEVSPGGCLSKCHEAKNEPFSTMTLEYFHKRESGEKNTCKCFSPLDDDGEPVFDDDGEPVFDDDGEPVFDDDGEPVFDDDGE